jgi:hypothetical protein
MLGSRLGKEHQTLAWRVLTQNIKAFLAPYPKYAPLITAESVPPWLTLQGGLKRRVRRSGSQRRARHGERALQAGAEDGN